MTDDQYPYPEDEFDELGRERTPQSVHRAPRPIWQVWGPLVAVVILCPLLAIGIVRLATSGGPDSGDNTPPPAATATAEPTQPDEGEGAGGEGTEGAEPGEGEEQPVEPTEPEVEEPAEPEAPAVDQSIAVSVLNGAGVQGLAGSVQQQLNEGGWTDVTAGNYRSAQPTVNTVYYRAPELKDAADLIATQLGIENVTELGSIESITVVLRTPPQ